MPCVPDLQPEIPEVWRPEQPFLRSCELVVLRLEVRRESVRWCHQEMNFTWKKTKAKDKVMPPKRAKVTSKELVRIRHVIIGILPYVQSTELNRDANWATNVC